jgi:glycerol-3-phosphate dehydrogenase
MKRRSEALRTVEANSFDVCVIGGGATGSGCALDSQLRGLNTVQFEAADFASATSSTSTKMVHGGVRYFEQALRRFDPAEYKVVKRALRERIRMLENAPFLTRTMVFIAPCFGWIEAARYEIGLKLYDWLAGAASLSPSHFLSRDEALRRLPALNPERVVGAVAYADGQFDDARYNITLVKTFTEAGGEALNYVRVSGFEKRTDGKIHAVQVEDQLSHRRFVVRARAFVNATGPHADTIRHMATPGIPDRMRLSKGVHILLPLEVLRSSDALLIPKTEDGRVLFAIPWLGRLLVGTTEDEVTIHDDLFLMSEEVDYLLRHLNRYLSQPVTPDQVVSGSAGARPLVSSDNSQNTKKLARDHLVEFDPESGLISAMGGKWTTYRAMAEDTIDAVQKYLNGSITECLTKKFPLDGSEGYSPGYWQSLMRQFGLSESTAQHLAGKFGTRASEVMELATLDQELARPLVEGLAPVRAEVVFAARVEMAMSIEDVLARRLGLELYGWRESMRAAPVVATLLAREFDWSEAAECEAVDQYLERKRRFIRKAGMASEQGEG